MRVLITGGAGLLGGALLHAAPPGVEAHATRRRAPVDGAESHAVDLADETAVGALLHRLRPGLVIHTAYSNADPERDILRATAAVARGCAAAGAAMIHLSTDALLDGERAPYDEDAAPAPVHAYGRWKAAAESAVRSVLPATSIVRTSLILRAEPPDAGSERTLDALRSGDPVRLFTDELRCAIEVGDLAAQLWELAALPEAARAGVWNLAGPEALSRYALGVLLAVRHRLDAAAIVPVPSSSGTEARPRDLRLSTDRADAALRSRPRGASEVLARPSRETFPTP
jgi:dTDP-4-dehydrorhamnose reductase